MITVLRLGHRPGRDERITTHVALTARALGVEKFILTSDDERPIKTVRDVNERWGGNFEIINKENWREVIKEQDQKNVKIIHLTMYGIPLEKKIETLKSYKEDLMIIVGAEKVPAEIYEIVDHNIAIGNQPHSEVAALAIFLDRLSNRDSLQKNYRNAKLKIIPQEKGKKVVDKH